MQTFNRKLLVSLFNAQEAREAVLGGARIVDSEDPKSALGKTTSSRRILLLTTASFRFVTPRLGRWSSSWEEGSMLFSLRMISGGILLPMPVGMECRWR